MMKRVIFYFLLPFNVFLGICHHTKGQRNNHWELENRGYYGAIFRQELEDPLLLFPHLSGYELSARKQSFGAREWEKYLKYPSLEFTLGYYNYGMPGTLGESVMFATGLQLPVFRRLKWSIGVGGVYSNKIHHPTENSKNKAISTKVSAAIKTDLAYPFNLSERLDGHLSFSFRHFSNGNIQKPNYGLNFPMIGAGFTYQLYKEKPPLIPRDTAEFDRKIHFHLMFNRGWKNPSHFVTTRFRVNAISLYLTKKFAPVNSWLLGLDGFYDTSLYVEYWHQTDQQPPFEADNFIKQQAAFTAGHVLHLGKFSVVTVGGYLFYLPYPFHSRFYQRYGFQYHPFRYTFLNVTLKAFRGTADLIELGMGLSL